MAISRRQFDTFCKVTHSHAPCNRMWLTVHCVCVCVCLWMHKNTKMPTPCQRWRIMYTFSSGLLSIYLNPCNRLSSPLHRHTYANHLIERIGASNMLCVASFRLATTSDLYGARNIVSRFCVHHKNVHIIATEWQSKGITHVANMLCVRARVICVVWLIETRNNRSKMLRLSHAKLARQQQLQKENYLLIMHLINANIHLYVSAHEPKRCENCWITIKMQTNAVLREWVRDFVCCH